MVGGWKESLQQRQKMERTPIIQGYDARFSLYSVIGNFRTNLGQLTLSKPPRVYHSVGLSGNRTLHRPHRCRRSRVIAVFVRRFLPPLASHLLYDEWGNHGASPFGE